EYPRFSLRLALILPEKLPGGRVSVARRYTSDVVCAHAGWANCQRLVQTVEGLSSIVIELTSSATRTPQRLAQSSLNSLKARRIRRGPIGAHLWNCPCTRKNRRHGPRTLHSNTERPRRSSLG